MSQPSTAPPPQSPADTNPRARHALAAPTPVPRSPRTLVGHSSPGPYDLAIRSRDRTDRPIVLRPMMWSKGCPRWSSSVRCFPTDRSPTRRERTVTLELWRLGLIDLGCGVVQVHRAAPA